MFPRISTIFMCDNYQKKGCTLLFYDLINIPKITKLEQIQNKFKSKMPVGKPLIQKQNIK